MIDHGLRMMYYEAKESNDQLKIGIATIRKVLFYYYFFSQQTWKQEL